MKKVNLYEYLSANEYPGRGIVLGRSADGEKMMIGYFIMGRSENSRNRVFVTEGEGIRTEAFDPSKLQDPSLIIYAPVRVLGENTIVTNGDQTDTIYDFMAEGKSFEDALRNAVSLGGDADTLTDITCAIAWPYYARRGCDALMQRLAAEALAMLPDDMRVIVETWEAKYGA